MSTLYVTELKDLPFDYFGRPMPAPKMPAEAEQGVSISGVSVQSSAFGNNTHYIMVHPDATCSIAIGTNPTAVNTAHRIKQDERLYYGVTPGHKIAVITNT
jgi:hypothetical protein